MFSLNIFVTWPMNNTYSNVIHSPLCFLHIALVLKVAHEHNLQRTGLCHVFSFTNQDIFTWINLCCCCSIGVCWLLLLALVVKSGATATTQSWGVKLSVKLFIIDVQELFFFLTLKINKSRISKKQNKHGTALKKILWNVQENPSKICWNEADEHLAITCIHFLLEFQTHLVH